MDNIDKQINDIFYSVDDITPETEYEIKRLFVHNKFFHSVLRQRLRNKNKKLKLCCRLTSNPIEIMHRRKLIEYLFEFYIGENDIIDLMLLDTKTMYEKILEIHPNIEKTK